MSLADKLASKLNKLSHGTSRLIVRDSYRYAASTMIGFIALTAPLFLFNNTHATSSSITVTIDDNIVDLNVAPTANGAFSKSSASKIGVSTTNYTGYTLSIAAQEGDNPTALVNGDKSLPSIENAITEDQFRALDATSYNNMWGYLPSKFCKTTTTDGLSSTTCATNDSFLPSPTTEGDTLDITSTANTTVNEYEITLGARVDTTASLGGYSNVFLVEAIANATSYTITFVDNTVTDMPVDMNGTSDTDTVAIVSTVPVRNGYTFLGWCRGTVTNNVNGNDTCSGTIYNPNGNGTNLNVTIDQTSSSNNITLYAMWGGNYTIGALVASGATMQDLGTMGASKQAKIIDSMVEETNYTLKDSRDNQSYTISKLKDGQVWMTTNLNIAGGTALSANDTDIPAAYTLPTANGFQSDNKLPASSPTGFDDNTKAFVYNSGNTKTTGDTNCGTSGNTSPCYSYYSYIAATAGSGLNVSGNGEDAAWSICPKGWRLPTSGNHTIINASDPASYKRGDFYRLATAYGINLENAHSSSNSTIFYSKLGPGTNVDFILAGAYTPTFSYGGYDGTYRASTSTDDAGARALYFYANYVGSAGTNNRRYGFSVRCILK